MLIEIIKKALEEIDNQAERNRDEADRFNDKASVWIVAAFFAVVIFFAIGT